MATILDRQPLQPFVSAQTAFVLAFATGKDRAIALTSPGVSILNTRQMSNQRHTGA